MKNFEMAHAGDTEGLIKASRDAVLNSMLDVIRNFKSDLGGPGLTWAQIEFLIQEFKKKEPTIIMQGHEL